MPLVPQTTAATWSVLCASVCLLFSVVLSLTLSRSSAVFSLVRSFQVSATSPTGRHGSFFSSSSLSSLSILFLLCFLRFFLFYRMCMSCLSYPVL